MGYQWLICELSLAYPILNSVWILNKKRRLVLVFALKINARQMVIDDLNFIIDYWITALDEYGFTIICLKPSPKDWSLGQLYLHLIADTNFYIEQIRPCLLSDDHILEEASPMAKTMFYNNVFPDEILVGAPGNDLIPQPESKEQLMCGLTKLREDINTLAQWISKTPFQGKSKHPGFGHFNAAEWLQFVEMHFRHHLRQKKRIDDYLKMISTNM